MPKYNIFENFKAHIFYTEASVETEGYSHTRVTKSYNFIATNFCFAFISNLLNAELFVNGLCILLNIDMVSEKRV